MAVLKVSALPLIRPFEGVSLRVSSGERGMLSFVYFEPDGAVPPHSHPHEQMGLALEGSFELTIDGETRLVQEGDIWHIAPNVVHSARAVGEKAAALDIFIPSREDYAALADSGSDSP